MQEFSLNFEKRGNMLNLSEINEAMKKKDFEKMLPIFPPYAKLFYQRIISSETGQEDDDIDGFIWDDVQEE